jgi:hypothetical protein
MKSNGVKHITSAPYHPATNRLAERSVQTFKQALRSMDENSKPIEGKLAKFLITYRNTPYSTTGESPAQLMLGRSIWTRLDIVVLDYWTRITGEIFNLKIASLRSSRFILLKVLRIYE